MTEAGQHESGAGARLLVVDDEPTQREMLTSILERAGYRVSVAADGQQAVRRLEAQHFDLMLTDQKMPGMDGLELLDRARAQIPDLPVVLMTAYGTVSSAVEAMKRGAADYLTKPFERDELLMVLSKVLRHRRLEDKVAALHGVLRDRHRLGGLIGSAPAMQEIFDLVGRVAHTDVPVLIQGESGTGKELVAAAIHEASRRSSGPFVAMNCAAVPETLLESEFFGHERGAFTGAVRARPGRFRQAHGGTIFLDEIGAMRVDLQAKLLRALQDQQIQPLGSTGSVQVDVRILAATGENLEEAIRDKRFREDLYYRLNVVPITLPPLRERREDIPLLLDHFLSKAARKFEKEPVGASSELLERLQMHSWPGNMRELENCVERMVLLARSAHLTPADLPPNIRRGTEPGEEVDDLFQLPAAGVRLQELERHLIVQALERTRGALGPAARLLGISYKTLQYRIQKHQIGQPGDPDVVPEVSEGS